LYSWVISPTFNSPNNEPKKTFVCWKTNWGHMCF
jgi:hypothetical protein